MRKDLLQAAEVDVKALGAKGLAAPAIFLPLWMKACWFKNQRYQKVDKNGMRILLWKPFVDQATPSRWIRTKKRPSTILGKIGVTPFINDWCPAQNMVFERMKRASMELWNKVAFQEIHTHPHKTFLEWGISNGIYIDGNEWHTGPSSKYKKIKKILTRKMKELKSVNT